MSEAVETFGFRARVGFDLDARMEKPWPAGPWDGEPDRIEWREGEFVCLMLRNRTGAWCGYVGVPPGHAWHGQDYDNVRVPRTDPDDEWSDWVDVNGGLTFSGSCTGEPPDNICHVAAPGEADDVWWLGFDCAHLHDVVPGMMRMGESWGEASYKDVPFVKREVERLVEQAASALRPEFPTP